MVRELSDVRSLGRDGECQTAKAVELIIGTMFQNIDLPKVEWSKTAAAAHEEADQEGRKRTDEEEQDGDTVPQRPGRNGAPRLPNE